MEKSSPANICQDAPQNPARRRFGAVLASGAALAAGSALPALAQEHPIVTPRAPRKAPRPFEFRVSKTPEKVGFSGARLKHVHEYLQRRCEAGDVSGLVTAIARRGELVHYEAHGYSNALTKTPMTLDAMFRMASSTKPFTGVSLLMMFEEGKLKLEDPVSRYIPEFKTPKVAVLKPGQPERRATGAPPREVDIVPATREITILDLATHTSGLVSGGAGADYAPTRGPDDTLATYIPKLGAVPLDFQPGTRWQYSGGAGIDTIGRIVEIVSGQDLDTFMRQRIFEPLGIVDTYFNAPAEKWARVLPQQRKTNGQWQVTPNPAAPTVTKYFSGAGGHISTCKDQLLFEQMLVNGGELNGHRLLGPRTVELMGANHVGDLYTKQTSGPFPAGNGFGITVRRVVDWAVTRDGRSDGAFGWEGAFGTMAWCDPAEELAGVIMMQQTDRPLWRDWHDHPRSAYRLRRRARRDRPSQRRAGRFGAESPQCCAPPGYASTAKPLRRSRCWP